MASVKSPLRRARAARESLRFRLWAMRLDLRLRRNGSRLRVEAPHGAHFFSLPHVEIHLEGGDGRRGSVTLRVGRDVKLGRGLTLDIWAGGNSVLELGDRATFQSWCRVQLHDGHIAIANDVQIRDYVLIKSKGELTIGEWSILSRDVVVHSTERISIADRVGIGERSSLIDSEHAHDGSDAFFLDNPIRTAPVVIEANVLLHMNTVVLAGTTVRRNVMVAAGALLTPGEYDSGWLFAGVPARPVRRLDEPRGERDGAPGRRRSGTSSYRGPSSPSSRDGTS